MCGIAGIFGLEDKQLLLKMLKSIKYRGPDDQGTHIGDNVSIGQVRLSIIDLTKAGRNPIYNEDGSVFVVYNGEIYNFRTIRDKLEKKGHQFHSKTDSEIIVHAYEEWGIDYVKNFNGMFAFALFDKNKKKLFLCRDQYGIKPLFYSIQENYFFFASEIKSLLETNYIKPEINTLGLYYCLSFLCTPSPYTLYKGINKLAPGHYIEIDSKMNLKITKYYDINNISNNFNDTLDIAIKKSEKFLRESIERMRYSDVPQGVLLSGGIDSSSLVAILDEIEDKPIETFSIGIANYGEMFNELKWAKLIHEKFNTNHHESLIEAKDVPKLMQDFINEQYDFIADPACILTYKLSKEVQASKVKVVHVGEGADEIYCGYPSYSYLLKYFYLYNSYNRLPISIKNIFYNILKKGGKSFETLIEKKKKANLYYSLLGLIDRLNEEWLIPSRGIMGILEHQKSEILKRDLIPYKNSKKHIYNLLKSNNRHTKGLNQKEAFIQDIRFLEFKIRLPELILMRVDNSTMLSSIEARVPFFDRYLLEYNLSLSPPIKFHYNHSINKYILKSIMKDKLPKEILTRKKIGLSTPISWNKSLNFSNIIENELSKNYMRKYFNNDFLMKIIKNERYRRNIIPLYSWLLVNFSFLYQKVILKEKIIL